MPSKIEQVKVTSVNRDEREIFEKTAQRLMDNTSMQDEIDSSWSAIEKQMKKTFLSRYKVYLSVGAIAASIAAAVFFAIYPNQHFSDQLSLALLNDTEDFGSEIILIADNKKQIELAHESTLKYGANGAFADIEESKNEQEKDKTQFNRVIVPKGKRVNVTFSDGTSMHVNSGTQVIYPSVFAKDRREILVQGEIYLDVAKDIDRPFIVKTDQMDIKVLGTSFNVSAYKEDDEISVVLVEGSVEVKNKNKETHRIQPNQRITLTNSLFSIKTVDVNDYIAWTDDIMVINNLNCGEILKKIARYYGVDIQYNENLNQIRAGGELNLKNGIDDVMQNLCLSFNLKYNLNEDGSIVVNLNK